MLREEWRFALENAPLFATQLGVHTFDDRIPDLSREARANERMRRRAFLASARNLREAALTPEDKTTLDLFIEQLEYEVATEVCRFEDWSLSPRRNPVTEWNYLPELHTISSIEDFENLVARYRGIPASIDAEIENLRAGAKDGLLANRESTRRVLKMVDDQLRAPLKAWPLVAPVQKEHPKWPEDTRKRLFDELSSIVEKQIRPALQRYRALIAEELLPRARPPERAGLGALALGKACYDALVRQYTTLPTDAEAIHKKGLAEIERIDAAMAKLGKELFDLDDRKGVLHRLRTDEDLRFRSAEAIEKKAQDALAKAKAAMPKFFGTLPQADCVVRRIPDYEAPFTTIAYYRQPNPDGSKPGEYFVNVYKPNTRPRYEAEALAFHESIPGHHLQIAIAQELDDLPAFRKHSGMTVFVEGWALYTEQLSDEMGLYSGGLDRMGMLSYEAWRAARLVVDTGLHAFGWTRDRAKQFMLEHTALAANNIDNEVDRYIVWPGQALAYKTGQLEIWRLRRAAEAELGDRFSLAGFHDAVLAGGAVSLPVLNRQVQGWVARVAGKPSSAPEGQAR